MIKYNKNEYGKIISYTYETEDKDIVSFEEDKTNYISSSGIYHFDSITEGNSEGDFGRYLEFKEVKIINKNTFNDIIELIPNSKVYQDGEYDEFYFSSISYKDISEIENNHYNFNSYEIDNNLITLKGEGFSLSIPLNTTFVGFIRFSSLLFTSEKYKTFISKDGSVFSQDIIELYKVTEKSNEENN